MYPTKYANQGFSALFARRPQAAAVIRGSHDYPEIRGNIRFYQTEGGVMVFAEVWGLPVHPELGAHPVFGFHIHSGNRCTGNAGDPFADAMMHYNPEGLMHPYHAGDMPPLFGNDGHAFMAFLTNRFNVQEIIGKTVIIHSHPDDFTTQPAGDSGTKIACGEITA